MPVNRLFCFGFGTGCCLCSQHPASGWTPGRCHQPPRRLSLGASGNCIICSTFLIARKMQMCQSFPLPCLRSHGRLWFFKTQVLITGKCFPEKYQSPKGKCWGRHYFPSNLLNLEARMGATWETPVIIDLCKHTNFHCYLVFSLLPLHYLHLCQLHITKIVVFSFLNTTRTPRRPGQD